jgi:hypothetical protein
MPTKKRADMSLNFSRDQFSVIAVAIFGLVEDFPWILL